MKLNNPETCATFVFYVLVEESQLPLATQVLRERGHEVR